MPSTSKDAKQDPMRTGDKLRFCVDLMRKQTDLVRQIDMRANIVIGLSGATIAFAVNKVSVSYHPYAIPVLVCTAIVSIALALMAVKPPKFLSRHGQPESIFYHTNITKFTEKEFLKEVRRISSDIDVVVQQYATETYNIVNYSLRYKKQFAHLAASAFTFGLCVTVILWFI
jgi:hypothetical protein